MKMMKSWIFWVANYQVKLAHWAFNWIIINRMLQMLFFKTHRFRLASMITFQMRTKLKITLEHQIRDSWFKLIRRNRTSKKSLLNLLERKRTVASRRYKNIKWKKGIQRDKEKQPISEWIYKFIIKTLIRVR